jgi:hypothetical protein
MLLEVVLASLLGGLVAVDRLAGWGVQLGQPLVAACLAGALVNPGPDWEIWALRIPLGVGALLQLLLTDAALPAAQRTREPATAGVVGTTVALLAMVRLHDRVPLSTGGLLWVLVGVAAGLCSAWAGGMAVAALRARNLAIVTRADALAAEGRAGRFEALYWGAVVRIFLTGAIWTAGATLTGLAVASAAVPPLALHLGGGRVGLLFASLLGAGLGAAYQAHVGGRAGALRWASIGALATAGLLAAMRGASS